MWYVFDGRRNIADKDNLYYKGETYTFDGVEVYCLLGTGEADRPLFVDKNHDLSFYVNGSDWVDSNESGLSPGTFGYEWGGYRSWTRITDTAVGTGLSNTNSLINMNLQPSYGAAVWDKIKEFRESHSDNWFLPSWSELYLIYEAKVNLSNLSLIINSDYWSSSESDSTGARAQDFSNGNRFGFAKHYKTTRSRLCYTI